ncbi:lipopolysaccharide biosynthesis protein [Pedobacter mucosus]|uniref:lipopolysaccharide biosynthesis protein n=1 Tax=Pedobacter mucosus TaxID=2895286 RepID=UPI001EE42140|nr:lipopolysaccharide biosynthesis protein [Pedobacter mucosus]UKT63282.1 lipopolysaccharide biosynthesis protein [Pedobacter mucosus]
MGLAQNQQTNISVKAVVEKLVDWFKYLLSKWLIILTFTILGGALGIVYAVMWKPIYTAESTFVLEDGAKGGLGQYAGMASLIGIDIGGGGENGLFSGENILELYISRTMLVKTLLSEYPFDGKNELLVNRYINSNDLRKNWSKIPSLQNLSFNKTTNLSLVQDSILTAIAKDINKSMLTVTKPDKLLSIIKVQVKSNDELFAKAFNDLIVKNVNDFYVVTKTKKSLSNINVLQHQTDSVRYELNRAISGIASATDFNPDPNPARQILRVPSQRRQVDAEANKAILTELVKTLEMSKVSLRKETPLIQLIDQPVLPLDRTRFGKAKGLVIGMILGGFLIVISLLTKKLYQEILH